MSTILVVDGNPSNFDVIVDIFAHEAPTLYYASSGPQALELMAQTSVDLVLLDVMMPEMDGVEVCSRVKNDPRGTESGSDCLPMDYGAPSGAIDRRG
ncbi:MAG: response regulator [Cyanobacteria bacterium RI_101]|nr:response regulator [Cyanobacteria bacterium RI_101]